MLRGADYNHFDATLKNERARCEEAVERYNSACRPRSGVSEEEQEKLLRIIFYPSEDKLHRPVVPCKEDGMLGPNVKVEGPFSCSYGYNIKIFDSAYIGKNCNIDDAAIVQIGARTWLGPNVHILTSDVSHDRIDRRGRDAPWRSKQVLIAEEVIIGANAVIYPGVRIGRGARVEAFAIVKDDLPDNHIQSSVYVARTAG